MSIFSINPSTYSSYRSMKRRALYPDGRDRVHYAGVTISETWLGPCGFETFLKDMGPRPSLKHSIDRKDNNLGYAPGNCRWATKEEQGRNKRNNVNLTIDGETLTIAEWSIRSGVNNKTIRVRLSRLKWDAGKAVFTPAKTMSKKR